MADADDRHFGTKRWHRTFAYTFCSLQSAPENNNICKRMLFYVQIRIHVCFSLSLSLWRSRNARFHTRDERFWRGIRSSNVRHQKQAATAMNKPDKWIQNCNHTVIVFLNFYLWTLATTQRFVCAFYTFLWADVCMIFFEIRIWVSIWRHQIIDASHLYYAGSKKIRVLIVRITSIAGFY